MEDRLRDGTRAPRRVTPFVQAGLALLVAGTLVTFSFLAFRTGFAEQPRTGIEVVAPDQSDRGPVLLPSPQQRVAEQDRQTTETAAADTSEASDTDARDERVLARREDRTTDGAKTTERKDDNDDRDLRTLAAREEEDPEADDHGDDDDDTDKSRSWSRRSKNSGGHSRGKSDGHSNGSRSNGSRSRSRGSRG